jgi:hypothetical protein
MFINKNVENMLANINIYTDSFHKPQCRSAFWYNIKPVSGNFKNIRR